MYFYACNALCFFGRNVDLWTEISGVEGLAEELQPFATCSVKIAVSAFGELDNCSGLRLCSLCPN